MALHEVLDLDKIQYQIFIDWQKAIILVMVIYNGVIYIPYSAKCWWGETLAKSLYSCNWKVKLWQIE